jgi:TldD protein
MTQFKDPLNIATEAFLTPNELSLSSVQSLLGDLYIQKNGFGDLYFQTSRHESWVLEDGIVKEGSYSHDCGVGVRAVCGERTGFSYSDDLSFEAISTAVSAARKIDLHAKTIKANSTKSFNPVKYNPLYTQLDPLDSITTEQKLSTLRKIDQIARTKDNRIKEVIASLNSLHEVVMVMATDGTLAADIRPMVRLSVSVIAEDAGKRERGSSGGGGRISMEHIVTDAIIEKYVDEAIDQALTNLYAKSAPAGQMPVVLGNGWPGVMLHEAVGHGLEGDFNRKGSSNFSGKIGQKVASELCTVVDDGTIADKRGSLSIDDEGVVTQATTLIENGVLKTYMQDKRNALLMDMPLTGNGRRESYAHLPMPRMTNTYMKAGTDKVSDMIASIDHGIYAVNFGGGQVDITSGKFVFAANKAFMIEKGKVAYPVKGVTLIGNGPDIMNKICMLGDDLELDSGVGVCGKAGQSVPVGVGQPSLKISEITVGGTS